MVPNIRKNNEKEYYTTWRSKTLPAVCHFLSYKHIKGWESDERRRRLGELPKKKTGFFWEISPKYGWVGWLTPKQGPNPSKPPQIAPKIAFFDPNFTFRSPKSHKNPGVGGWVNRFGRDLPKKTSFFFWQLPLVLYADSRILKCGRAGERQELLFWWRVTHSLLGRESHLCLCNLILGEN